jgi:hypothetical protein
MSRTSFHLFRQETKRKKTQARGYTSPIKRARISKVDAAETLLLLMEEGVSKQTSDGDIIEDTLPDIETDSELSKEKDVQTSINLENLKTLSTECLINPNEMQKCLFLKNVATDSLHYTGTINHLYTMYSIST